MNMRKFRMLAMVSIALLGYGCASTIQEAGKGFDFKPITVNRTTKQEVLAAYGQPTKQETLGKYDILVYYHVTDSLKHGRFVGMAILNEVTSGISGVIADNGVKSSDIQRDFQEMKVYVALENGIVRDYYYHDSQGQGQDNSETLWLKSMAEIKAGQNEQAIKTLHQALSENPNNHRALNTLAWTLIDLNINPAEGVELAKKAVEIFPDAPHNNGTLGVGYYKTGNLKMAKEYLEKALALNQIYSPNNQEGIKINQGYLNLVNSQLK